MSRAASAAPAPGPPAAQPATSRAVAGCSITAPAGGGGGEGVAAYDADVMPVLDRFMAAASSLGDDVAKPSTIVRDAFAGAFPFITHCARCIYLQQRATADSARTDSSVRQPYRHVLARRWPEAAGSLADPAALTHADACAGQRQVLAAIAACSKPDAAGLQQLVGPVGEQMQKVRLLTTDVHASAVAELHACSVLAAACSRMHIQAHPLKPAANSLT